MEPRQARVITEIYAYPAVQAEWDVLPIEEQASLLESGLVIRGESWCEGGWLYTADPDAAKKAEAYDLDLEPTKPRYWRKWRKARLRHRKVFRPMRQFNDVLAWFVDKHEAELREKQRRREMAQEHAKLLTAVMAESKMTQAALARAVGASHAQIRRVLDGKNPLNAEQFKDAESLVAAGAKETADER